MNEGVVSPVFAGRADELAVLAGAFEAAAAGTPRTVLVGAEAGGGKSRLAAEFAAQVAGRGLVLAGWCVELSAAGLPYAPFAAALRELVRERGAAEVAGWLPGQGASELARLLPEFGAPAAVTDPETARARLFELLLGLLEAVAEEQPVVLVVEDVHWADPATCDLLSFLIRNLRHAAMLLVATFRSDSLHHTHPLRRLLAELDRMAGVTRLELPRLSRDQVAAQLGGILGTPPPVPVTSAVHARGGGNPLFTEALVNRDGTVRADLPWSLRDLLLAAVKDLPEQAQQLLGAVAVAGSRVSHALLAAATGVDDAALTAALRPAVAANVLISDTDGYAFRHELIREAVLGDLLPGERAQAHRRFAQVLAESPALSLTGTAAVQVARHWLGAREFQRAMIAAWRAGAAAGESLAYAEQLIMLEQVLELWDQVPDPAGETGADRIGVLMAAADAARRAGQPERGLSLAEMALTEHGQAGDAGRRASLLRRRAGLLQDLLLPGQIDDLQAALALASSPAPVRAQVLAQLCWALMREDRCEESGRAAGELRDLAARLGDGEYQAEAAMALAALAARKGQDTAAELRGALEAATRIGSGRLEAWAYLTITNALEGLGDHEQAIQAGRDGLARARQLGLGRQIAAPIAANLAESLTSAGRWDEALEIAEEILGLGLPPLGREHALLILGTITLARGDQAAAAQALRELHSMPAGVRAEAQRQLPLSRLDIDSRLAEGDVTGALAAAATVPACDLSAHPRYSWPLLAAAMRASADASAPGPGRRAGELARLAEDLTAAAATITPESPVQRAHAATFAAEASRAGGRQDLAGWDAAAAAWDAAGQPYPLAYALLRAAGAASAEGKREAAISRLGRAAGLAGQLAAQPLQQQLSQLARRARIPLASPGSGRPEAAAAVPFGLTAREQEVLKLVAAGHSNRDIAAELFISRRTASVHVSNILGKLGAASRGEAAAAAFRLHLLD